MRDSGGVAWPDLAFGSLAPTVEVLHLVAQIVGKVRMGLTPWVNHSWHVPLYVSARGLATGWIPAEGGALDMEIDLFRGALVVRSAEGSEASVDLRCETVARICAETMAALARLGVVIQIDETPCEIPGAVPFSRDLRPRAFEGEAARTYWRALLQAQRVFQRFRTRFVGKCSPVHLFWGSFDLAVTRFSGRPAPPHPGGAEHMPDAVARDGYFQELASAGFLAGRRGVPWAGLLRLWLSRPAWLCRGRRRARRRGLQPGTGRIPPALCRGSGRRRPGRRADGVSGEHLPRGRGPYGVGQGEPGARRRPDSAIRRRASERRRVAKIPASHSSGSAVHFA